MGSIVFGIDRKTIRGEAKLGALIQVGSVVALLVAACGLGFVGIQSIDAISERLTRSEEKILPLQSALQQLRYETVHVQQALTGLSATRGLDGLDDGFSTAEAAAQAFQTHAEAVVGLATELGLPELVAAVDATQQSFEAFYIAGKTMANAYVRGGPEMGNSMMFSFGLVAETISQDLEDINGIMDSVLEQDKIDAAEANARAWNTVTGGIAFVLILALLASWVVVGITRARFAAARTLERAAGVVERASRGDLNSRITDIRREDEIGGLLHNLNDLLDLVEAFSKEAGAAMKAASQKRYYRKIMADGMRGEFGVYVRRINAVIANMELRDSESLSFAENNVLTVVKATTEKADHLQQNVRSLNEIAEQTIERAMVMSSAAEQATINVGSVASATVELSASIDEINRQMAESARMAEDAVEESHRTNEIVVGLSGAAQRIGDVVKLINGIAGQTNLLALNATIEAARAGEAGKGFAVVANEVKNLASQTGAATDDITKQIEEIQEIASNSVAVIGRVGEMLNRINDNIRSVTTAVVAQGEATAEISRNIQETATGTKEVATNIEAVTVGAEQTMQMAKSMREATDQLAADAKLLHRDMGQFVDKVRMA